MEVKNLKAYLANIEMKLQDFCEIVDIDIKHMSKIMNGHRNAGHRLAKDVKELTSGLITLRTRVRKRDIQRQLKEQKKQQKEQEKYAKAI